jgi:uncharacterized protein (TIGR03083 family)
MQKPAPILIADRFPPLLTSLLDLLNGLTPVEWERPTAAAAWSVKDVALHLLGDDLSKLSGGRDGFHEAWYNATGWDDLVAWLNCHNAQWVEAARRISAPLLCDLLKHTGEQVNSYFASLDLMASGFPVSWAGENPAPVWLDVAREFTERWHHQQHIRDAVGKPGATGAYFLGPVLAAFVYGLPRAYARISAAPDTCITLTIQGEAGGVWSIRLEQDDWQLYRGAPASPHASVTLPEDAAWRLFTKGISKETAQSQAVFAGDPALGRQMLEVVSIIA